MRKFLTGKLKQETRGITLQVPKRMWKTKSCYGDVDDDDDDYGDDDTSQPMTASSWRAVFTLIFIVSAATPKVWNGNYCRRITLVPSHLTIIRVIPNTRMHLLIVRASTPCI